MTVRFQLLGAPSVEVAGRASVLAFERRGQLAAYLALKRGWVGRGEIAAMLWPELPDKLAYTNLRKALFRLQTTDWGRGVQVQGGALRFDAATDVADFEEALKEDRIGDAARLGASPLLAGFDDGQSEPWSLWLTFERDRLRTAWRGAVLRYLETDLAPAQALGYSTALLETDPLDEVALRMHMAWLACHGQAAAARRAYRDFTERLSRELGTAPTAELRALHDSLAADPAGGAPRTAVVVPRDEGLVGRASEVRHIAERFAGDCRLLCIAGPGGMGKTHLARHALARLAADYPDASAFVAVEDAESPRDIGDAIARALGLSPASRAEPGAGAIEYLRGRRALLVLDNFEHLVAYAGLLEAMLDECPGLRLLVTSRVRLGTASEHVLPLEGLPCPEAGDDDRIEAFDAACFFVKAARRVEPGLVPDAEAAAIAEICRLVEGMPLALELAAAWTRVMSCAAIVERLRDGIDLLSAQAGARSPRHASMELVFDASWRLLGAAERDALCRLSVFRGGLSPDAARDVAHAPAPVLAALVDKSLLRKDDGRLHLHALVQRLASERLEASGEADATRQAHAAWCLRLLGQLRESVKSADREALRTVDSEFQNARAAWSWAVHHDMGLDASRAMQALVAYCDYRLRHLEGHALLLEGVESSAARSDTAFAHRALASLAHFEYRLERYAEGEAAAQRALASAKGSARLQALKVLGACCLRQGRLAEAKDWFEQALQSSPARVDPRNAAAMLDNIALVEKSLGRYRESMRLSHRSLMQYRQIEDAAGQALCLNNLAALCLDRGDFELAGSHLREAAALCERHGLASTRLHVLANLTELGVKTGDLDAAELAADRAAEAVALSGNRFMEGWFGLQRAMIATRRGDLPAARAILGIVAEKALSLGSPVLSFSALHCVAEIVAAQGHARAARRLLAFGMGLPGIDANMRNQFEQSRRMLPAAKGDDGPLPDLALEDFLQRVALEGAVAYKPLLSLVDADFRVPTPRLGVTAGES